MKQDRMSEIAERVAVRLMRVKEKVGGENIGAGKAEMTRSEARKRLPPEMLESVGFTPREIIQIMRERQDATTTANR